MTEAAQWKRANERALAIASEGDLWMPVIADVYFCAMSVMSPLSQNPSHTLHEHWKECLQSPSQRHGLVPRSFPLHVAVFTKGKPPLHELTDLFCGCSSWLQFHNFAMPNRLDVRGAAFSIAWQWIFTAQSPVPPVEILHETWGEPLMCVTSAQLLLRLLSGTAPVVADSILTLLPVISQQLAQTTGLEASCCAAWILTWPVCSTYSGGESGYEWPSQFLRVPSYLQLFM